DVYNIMLKMIPSGLARIMRRCDSCFVSQEKLDESVHTSTGCYAHPLKKVRHERFADNVALFRGVLADVSLVRPIHRSPHFRDE
ncbi:MAG: hypothetical protein WBQ23_10830, partial [Bacteroidota bacterium]